MTTRTPTLERIAAVGVVPVVELPSLDQAAPLAEALLRAGLEVVEVTLRSEAGLHAIEKLRTDYPALLVGGGTVRTAADAERVLNAGAQFVVSPSTSQAVIELCCSRGITALPGTCTPTEIDTAIACGAEAVKFFPAEAMGGVAFLKALAGPFRDVSFVPTGGIGPGNVADYLCLPAVLACGGSWMVTPALLASGSFDQVEELARGALAIVAEVRGKARTLA
ncbi:MAG: bifunctional 4-hydroxy-2-oxoglutarate aldolase/2-dehydro-3-deoxy-phosphogluconate aldolase [Acidimicrobiales bacterium]|jgi:2-dehydro-3-deoxyphosphogluconate aldolase/(4S)-4-hydroxy-2-oxoglutarate aldolase